MLTSSNILSLDYKFATIWILFEVIISFVVVSYLANCIINRKHARKPIDGCNVLITNGSSELSQIIGKQLTEDHQCHVIFLSHNEEQNLPSINRNTALSTHYACNLYDHHELKNVATKIDSHLGGIDFLIENNNHKSNYEFQDQRRSCEHFIDITSRNIMLTLNLLIHFVPLLNRSKWGQFISIQSNSTAATNFLDTKSEIRELVKSVSGKINNKNSNNQVHLSTVVYKCRKSKFFGDKLNRHVEEVATDIISSIGTKKKLVIVKQHKSLIEYLLNIIK